MWEYRIEQIDMHAPFGNFAAFKPPEPKETQLVTQLGGEGWELVNVVGLTTGGFTKSVRLYFKRQRGRYAENVPASS